MSSTYLKIRKFPLPYEYEVLFRPTCIRLALSYYELNSWWFRINGNGNPLDILNKKSWTYLLDVIKFPFTDLSNEFLLRKY